MRTMCLMLVLLSAPACVATPGRVGPAAMAYLPDGGASEAPNGFVQLCARDGAACAEPVATRITTPVGEDRVALINRINRQVNGKTRQRSDQQLYARGDYWQASGASKTASGDCEDLALEKQARLLAAGVPRDDVRLGIVYRRDVGLHAVVIARTHAGDMVLDSRTPYVNRWDDIPYSWVSQQSASGSMRWNQVGVQSPTQVAALASGPTGTLGRTAVER